MGVWEDEWEGGSVGGWECGRVGVWEDGRVGGWECGNMGGWECGRVGVWEYGRMSVGGSECGNGVFFRRHSPPLTLFCFCLPLSHSPPHLYISLSFLFPFSFPPLSLKPAVSVILHWFWKGLSLSTSVAPHSWENGSLSSPLSTKSSQQEGKALSVTVKNSILQYITVYLPVCRSRAHKNWWLE